MLTDDLTFDWFHCSTVVTLNTCWWLSDIYLDIYTLCVLANPLHLTQQLSAQHTLYFQLDFVMLAA